MSDVPYLGQTTDLALGQDFLTWLWFRSEIKNTFADSGGRPFTVSMEKRIVVQGGEGENLETASVSGPMSELREARLGLNIGKKVTRAQIVLSQDPEEWGLTLKAEDFTLNGLKTPAVVTEKDGDGDPDALFFEKIHLIETCLDFMDSIYKEFLSLRLSRDWEDQVAQARAWMQSNQ